MKNHQSLAGRTGWFMVLSMTLVVLLAAFPVLMQTGGLSSHLHSALWCVVIWIIGYGAIILSDARGLWSPAAIYFVIFAFFHFSLAVMLVLGGSTDDISWFLEPEVPQAFALVGLGGIGLALGSIAPVISRAVLAYRTETASIDSEERAVAPNILYELFFSQVMSQISAVIAIGCILGWILMTLMATGGNLFGLSYGEFLNATESYPRPWLTFGIAIGVTLAAIDLEQRASRITLGMFIVWALIALPIGIRGDVMFTAAGALAAQGWKLCRIPVRYFIGGAVAMLCVASLLREVRAEGIAKVDWRWEVVSPANALKELGQSLRPTYETIRWLQDGDQRLGGESFWSPIERGFLRLFPLQQRLEVDDDRQLIELVNKRVGPIGFSPIAEAYYNFGTTGVPLVMGVIGLLVGFMGMVGNSLLGRALMLSTLIPLLIFVRNSFTPVPAQMVIGWSLVLIIWGLSAVIAKRLYAREFHDAAVPATSANDVDESVR